MEDEKIIELFFARSESAIEGVSKKYGGAMRSLSYNILHDHMDVEECINDTYLSLWNAIPPSRPNPLYAFVCRITRNISLVRYRYNTAQMRSRSNTVSLDEISNCIPGTETVDEQIGQQELTETLNEWLDTLSNKNLFIFMRRFWYMDSIDSIAEWLKMSPSAVSRRIARMKDMLYRLLKGKGYIA